MKLIKVFITLFISIVVQTAMMAAGNKGDSLSVMALKEECDKCRKEISTVDSASVQSYIAKVNEERAANQVVQQKLRTNKERNYLVLYIVMGGICVIGLLVAGLFLLRKYNRRLVDSQNRLVQARQIVENSVRLKNLFLSNMSHEIRTPLNALAGFSTILADNSLDKETRKQFEGIIGQNSDLLMKLIDDVVGFSLEQNNEMQFKIGNHDAVSICRNVVETVNKVKHTAATMSFSTTLSSLPLSTDEARLQQLLINLLVNAGKFTPQGSITLSLSADDKMAHFAVTDTGCGIPQEKREAVVNRFEKAHESDQGTGLGLSICRFIIERLGGKIWVDPEYHDGARFCFTHPLERKEDRP